MTGVVARSGLESPPIPDLALLTSSRYGGAYFPPTLLQRDLGFFIDARVSRKLGDVAARGEDVGCGA